jgi:hypothetical protein
LIGVVVGRAGLAACDGNGPMPDSNIAATNAIRETLAADTLYDAFMAFPLC